MAEERAERFVEALHALERDGEIGPLAQLFDDDCTLVTPETSREGASDARRFWLGYRGLFDEVLSEFHRVAEAGDLVTLEWTTRCRLDGGGDFSYDGVTLLDFDGERISRFRTFFDPAPVRRALSDAAAATVDREESERPEA
jgi:ketosteroid isomerase-like protein